VRRSLAVCSFPVHTRRHRADVHPSSANGVVTFGECGSYTVHGSTTSIVRYVRVASSRSTVVGGSSRLDRNGDRSARSTQPVVVVVEALAAGSATLTAAAVDGTASAVAVFEESGEGGIPGVLTRRHAASTANGVDELMR